MENTLSQIVKDINNENCVVILGPDICDFGKPFFEYMCDDFQKNSAHNDFFYNAPEYVFLNEELLQLRPDVKELTVLRMMEDFYHKQSAFDEPLQKIAQIPFHLIISLMPDDRLRNIFANQRLDHNYDYYPTEYSFKQIQERPTKQKPLIYNLLGDFKESDAVITFDTFFSFLTGIMGKRELPEVILESLQKARTILFLGVHFEKWHVQLLLKLITPQKKLNYSILNGNKSDTCLFVGKRLSLEFLDDDPQFFLNNLHQKFNEQGALKKKPARSTIFISYSHKNMALVKKITELLREREIEVVVDEDNMPGGQKIKDFISTINQVDYVIPILSENSLFSPWVIKEIATCIRIEKKILPYCLDNSLFEHDLNSKATDVVKISTQGIIAKMAQNSDGNLSDLVSEQNLWAEYKSEFPTVVDHLKQIKCPAIDQDNLKDFINNVVLRDLGLTQG